MYGTEHPIVKSYLNLIGRSSISIYGSTVLIQPPVILAPTTGWPSAYVYIGAPIVISAGRRWPTLRG